MQQLTNNLSVVAFILLLQGILLMQSAKAYLEKTLKLSHVNGNENNPLSTSMLNSLIHFLNERSLGEEESEESYQRVFDGTFEWQHPRSNVIQTDERAVDPKMGNNFNLWASNLSTIGKRTFIPTQFSQDSNQLQSYIWGSNPTFWRPVYQPSTPNKQAYYRPTKFSIGSRWESNPSFLGKRDYWTMRGKKFSKESPLKIMDKESDNLSFWKNRGKRDNHSDFIPDPSIPAATEDLQLEPYYWTNRGKKMEQILDRITTKNSNLKREIEKYWTIRGRRQSEGKSWKSEDNGTPDEGVIPYWLPRGKKNADFAIENTEA